MTTQDDAPEQIIRRWLERNGSAQVGTSAIAESWKLERLDAADRRRIAGALQSAGVLVEPPLTRAGARDKLQLSLAPVAAPEAAPPAPAAAEPEPEARVQSESEPPGQAPEPGQPSPATPAEPRGRRRLRLPRRSPRGPTAEPAPQAEPAAAATTAGYPARRSLAGRLGALAIALMVIGAFAPWAKAVFVTDYGTDRAGWVVLAVAAIAGVLLLVHANRGARSQIPLVAALLGTVAVAVVASDLRELAEDQFVGPAWGAYAAFAGSAGLVACSIAQLVRRG